MQQRSRDTGLPQNTNMAEDGESLESWLNKATNPSNRQEDWEYIMGFCDQINKELEGPQISVRLLAHKIQSPQEWEATQALTVLEACMKNCGQRFHNEVGKFKFLNELIKLLSPKYLGDKISENVKTKVISMLYSWTVSLPEESKICEVYQMLKSQGIVSTDPEISADSTLVPSPSPRPKNPVFEDEMKGKKLAELLKSKKAADLQEANRLIKSMVKEDEARAQKAARQQCTLEAANTSVKLLNEMLAHFSPHESTDGDKELIQELYADCDKLREKISQLASETEDNDKSLGEILQASDDLSQVINSCKKMMAGIKINGGYNERQQMHVTAESNQPEILVDLMGPEVENPSQPEQQQHPALFSDDLLCGAFHSPSETSVAASLLDEELLSLGLNEPVQKESTDENLTNNLLSQQDSSQDLDLFGTTPPAVPPSSTSSHLFFSSPVTSFKPSTNASTASILTFPSPLLPTAPLPTPSLLTNSVFSPNPLCSVLPPTSHPALSQPFNLTSSSLSAEAPQQGPLSSSVSTLTSCNQNVSDLSLLDLNPMNKPSSISSTFTSITSAASQEQSSSLFLQSGADEKDLLRSLSPILPLTQAAVERGAEVSLNNVVVPLETIKTSKVCPVTAYDKKGVRVLLHFATECPPGRSDVLVMVASMLNTSPQAVRKIVLQVAVPKTMKVKLQSPSGTELPPFNPILPTAAITQVMLLANPLKEKVRMRFKLTFMLKEESVTEVGEVNKFPPADKWGAL